MTLAERSLDASLYPDADPELLVPGSLVFRKTAGPVDLGDHHSSTSHLGFRGVVRSSGT